MEIPVAITAEEITRELLMILPALNRKVSDELRKTGGDDTTVVQLRVLSHLMDAPITLSMLARKRRVSLQAASEHVQSLVDRAWVVRIADPNDRRQSLLHITDEGRKQFEATRESLVKALTPTMEHVTPAEATTIYDALLTLRRVLQEPSND